MVPELPARNDQLSFSGKGRDVKFSDFKNLRNDSERGHCLHFFANHELQAIELMALALLKFPKMPSALKRQIISAIQDEQKHTRLYLNRMKNCSLELGHDRLNRFFWDALSQVNSIDAFLAGMSLTLEQANLDFASDFIQRFKNVGDEDTAKVLDVVLKDEIKHVRLGLEFFKKHHSTDERIWKAYCQFVEPPLFPSRAKAEPFQKDICQEIGFHDKDIEALQNYQRSKGRPPSVYFYNAFPHDFLSVKNARQLSTSLNRDFEMMPLWLAMENDVVVIENKPSSAWLAHLRRAEVKLPEFKVCLSREKFKPSDLGHHHLSAVHPWVLHPGMHEQMKMWNPVLKSPFQLPVDATVSKSDAKEFSQVLLSSFYEKCHDSRFGEPEHSLGIWIEAEGDLKDAVSEISGWGYQKIVLKANFGCAGQSLKKLTVGEDTWPTKWIRRILGSQNKIWVQPCFDIVEDFSLTGNIRQGVLKLDQLNHLITHASGRYSGHILKSSWAFMSEEIRRFMLCGSPNLLEIWKQNCHSVLAQKLNFFFENQNLGLDGFIYRNPVGQLKLMPVSELNARTTFGHLATKLSERLAPGRVGYFWLCTMVKDAQQLLNDSFNPLIIEKKKWWEGVFCLSDPGSVQGILPVCVVAENMQSCLDLIKTRVLNRDEQEIRALTRLPDRLKMDSHSSI